MFCCRKGKSFTPNHDLDSVLNSIRGKSKLQASFDKSVVSTQPTIQKDKLELEGIKVNEQNEKNVDEVEKADEIPNNKSNSQLSLEINDGDNEQETPEMGKRSIQSSSSKKSETAPRDSRSRLNSDDNGLDSLDTTSRDFDGDDDENDGPLSGIDRRGGLHGQKVDTNIEIPTFPKSEKVAEGIRCALLNNQFLRELIPKSELNRIVAAMSPREVTRKEVIIQQDTMGDQLFVSETGKYRFLVNNEIVGVFDDQRVFGELAVLYRNPRAATVQAISNGRTWMMEGNVFRALLVNRARNDEEQRVNFLKKCSTVNSASDAKLAQLAKLMKEKFYRGNSTIIKQGDPGNTFFVVKAGTVSVTREGEGKVAELSEGQFFGEKALTETDVRQATCVANPPGVTCLELSRSDFVHYFGEFQTFLKESAALEPSGHGGRSAKSVSYNVESVDFQMLDRDTAITIGVGGFGRVLLIRHIESKINYAMKMLVKVENRSAEQREHAINEKDIQKACRSGFIVRLFDTYQDSRYLYFVMEPCLGGDLFSLMQRQKGKCFDEDSARFIAACILEALSYLHRHSFIYRDLKPENMLIDSEGYIKLADFGFAKRLESGNQTYTFAGTPEYVAPEVIYSQGHNHAVDYWAFGIFVFELIIGKTPFKTSDPSYMKTYGLIIRGIDNIQFPHRIGKTATNLVKRLCRLAPHERLGCLKGGVSDIKEHKWFSGFDWRALYAKAIESKFVPALKSDHDTTNFDDFDTDMNEPPEDKDDEFWKKF